MIPLATLYHNISIFIKIYATINIVMYMKKISKIIFIFMLLFIVYGCSNTEIESKESDFIINETIATKGQFDEAIDSFMENLDENYSLVLYSIDMDDNYGKYYSLYDENDVDITNYASHTAIATFSVYFAFDDDTHKIVDINYNFPLNGSDAEEKDLEIEYSLYDMLLKTLMPEATDDTFEQINNEINLSTFDDFKKIYNNEENFEYTIIRMGENGEDYLSLLFLTESKKMTFEYHDSEYEIN